MSIFKEFQRISVDHRKAIQTKTARAVIGPSVGRVFQKNSVHKIWPVLAKINLDVMKSIESQDKYKEWFEKQLNKLASKIKQTNPSNKRIYPGYKWGHETKILCLFLNDIVIHRDFFNAKTANRLINFLYVPIDSLVMGRLKHLGIKLNFSQIKQISSKKDFYGVQDMLGEAAQKVGVPRIWFDDNWGDRQN